MDEPIRLKRHLPLFRACAEWTAKDLAEKLEVSRQSISAWENYDEHAPRKGVKMTEVQYYAIRKLLDDEIAKDLSDDVGKRNQHILGTLLEVLVDHPGKYTSSDVDAALAEAQLMAPSIMKQPEKRKPVSMVWPALLAGCGVALSAALIAIVGHDKD